MVQLRVRASSFGCALGCALYRNIGNRAVVVSVENGDVAQMVERAVSIGEVKGSMPFFSIFFDSFQLSLIFGCEVTMFKSSARAKAKGFGNKCSKKQINK